MYSYSNYMVASSMLFQIPAWYAWYHCVYPCAVASWTTSVLSMNYWRHPIPSWRRTIDVYWSRVGGTIYFLYGIQYSCTCGIPGCILMLFFYQQSWHQYNINPYGNWYVYHMMFHGIASINQWLCIYFVCNSIPSVVH
jgi:hypothetical protein